MKYQKNKPTVISTFSGCGGSSCGYKKAGCQVLLAVEMNNHAVATYRENFPSTKVFHGDIHNLTVEQALEITGLKPGELDILDGSPPCQGFSITGSRNYCDQKNQLYHEYVRLLRGLQPKTFVMENVTGLVKGKMKLIFKDILTQLKSSGYDVKAKVMNAQYYDYATSRERLIIIGVRKDLNIPASHPKPQTKPVSINKCLKGFKTKYPKVGASTAFVRQNIDQVKPGKSFAHIHPKGSYFNNMVLDLSKPCPTLTNQGYGKYVIDHRRLNPDEAAKLQSFPDNFKWVGLPSAQWERIGNSVPPNLMKAIALHIKENILNKIEDN